MTPERLKNFAATERNFRLMLIVAVALGLGIRWLVLRGANWRIDYDEGMVGLQVLRMLLGQFAIFHPGQPYLGNLESYLIAPFFILFGANNATLKLVPLLLSGAYVGTTGLIARASFGTKTGAFAALLAAIAPAYLVVVGLKAWGATIETIVLGNVVLLISLSIIRGGGKKRDWVLLGLAAGIAFWVSWLIAYYVIPAGLVLLWRFRATALRRSWIAALAFFLGGIPFWIYNVQYPLATFKYLLGGERSNLIGTAPRVLKNFVLDLTPRLVSGDPTWHLLSDPATRLLVGLYVLGLIALITMRPRRDSWLLATFTFFFLPIYLLSGFGLNALNPFGITDATGRYVLMLHSVFPIGVALLARMRLGVAAVAVVLVLNLVGVARIDPTPVFTSPYYTDQPASLQPLVDLLNERQITHVWTDIQIAHVLMFETHEHILAADYYDRMYAHGPLRFPEVFDEVLQADERGEPVAYMELILPGEVDTPIDRAFAAANVPYERLTPTPRLLVIIPRNHVDPEKVLPGLGYQYSK